MSSHLLFLGVADRASPSAAVAESVPMQISGLRRVVATPLFPLSIEGLHLVLAIQGFRPWSGQIHLSIEGKRKLTLTFSTGIVEPHREDEWFPIALPLKVTPCAITEPSVITITACESGGSDHELGSFELEYVPAAPLTADQRRAVRSNPLHQRAVRYTLRCRQCDDGITPYCAIQDTQPDMSDVPRPVWYKDLPNEFVCSCGTSKFPLRYLKESMHAALLRDNFGADGAFSFNHSLRIDDAEAVLHDFRMLLDTEPREEDVQRFIEEHLLILAPFGARRLFVKPPILTKYKADFGIVNSRNELLFIEIERPNLRLTLKEGAPSSELTHAFDQTHSWRQEILEHKRAVLECIKNCPTDITLVRYMVIAGRTDPYPPEHLTRLLQASRGSEFMTYDHLIEEVRATIRSAIQ